MNKTTTLNPTLVKKTFYRVHLLRPNGEPATVLTKESLYTAQDAANYFMRDDYRLDRIEQVELEQVEALA